MDSIYVLERDLTLRGIVDEYVSAIWRPSYSDIGDFELYLGADKRVINLLKKDCYLVRSSDIRVVNGVTTYHKVMVIKNLKLTTNVEDGDYLTVTGRELKYLLHSRIVWNLTTLTGTAENAIRSLVNANAISPSDSNRVIPDLILANSLSLSDTINAQVTGDYLDEAISSICNTYAYGWDIYINNGHLVFTLYTGLDRSFTQTVRPYVVFADSFDNLYNTEYELMSEEYANTTLVGGEGDGNDRKYATVNGSNTGLDRYETFTDARDVSSNDGAISTADYIKLLQERGKQNLADLQYTEAFIGEIISNFTFKYGEDFNLGDVVTVINSYGISKDVRVISCIESIDDTGIKLLPQFNI